MLAKKLLSVLVLVAGIAIGYAGQFSWTSLGADERGGTEQTVSERGLVSEVAALKSKLDTIPTIASGSWTGLDENGEVKPKWFAATGARPDNGPNARKSETIEEQIDFQSPFDELPIVHICVNSFIAGPGEINFQKPGKAYQEEPSVYFVARVKSNSIKKTGFILQVYGGPNAPLGNAYGTWLAIGVRKSQ